MIKETWPRSLSQFLMSEWVICAETCPLIWIRLRLFERERCQIISDKSFLMVTIRHCGNFGLKNRVKEIAGWSGRRRKSVRKKWSSHDQDE